MQELLLAGNLEKTVMLRLLRKEDKNSNENKWKQHKTSQQIYLYGKHSREKWQDTE
jgi:hypothetical protein